MLTHLVVTADKTEEVRRLGMGPLLSDMTRKMQEKVKNKESDPLKVLVHSTHDTAVAAITSTFDVFDERYVFRTSHRLALPTHSS